MNLDTRRPKMMRRVLVELLWTASNDLLDTSEPCPVLGDDWVQQELARLIFPEKRIKTQTDIWVAVICGFLFGMIVTLATVIVGAGL